MVITRLFKGFPGVIEFNSMLKQDILAQLDWTRISKLGKFFSEVKYAELDF